METVQDEQRVLPNPIQENSMNTQQTVHTDANSPNGHKNGSSVIEKDTSTNRYVVSSELHNNRNSTELLTDDDALKFCASDRESLEETRSKRDLLCIPSESLSVAGNDQEDVAAAARNSEGIEVVLLDMDTESTSSDVTGDGDSASDVTNDDHAENSASGVAGDVLVDGDSLSCLKATGVAESSNSDDLPSDFQVDNSAPGVTVKESTLSAPSTDDATESPESDVTKERILATLPVDDATESSKSDVKSDDFAQAPASLKERVSLGCDDCRCENVAKQFLHSCSSSVDADSVTQENWEEECDPGLYDADEESDGEDNEDNEDSEDVQELIRMVKAYRLFLPEDDGIPSDGEDADPDVASVDTDEPSGECEICAVESYVLVRPCCQLTVCFECLRAYIVSKVNEGTVHIQCPGAHCNTPITEYEILSKLPAQDMKKKYRKFLVEANKDPRVKTCPRCSLEYNLHHTVVGKKMAASGLKVTCSACQFDWCFPCHAPWHEGETCRSWRDRGTREFLKWTKGHCGVPNGLQVNARRCPGCKVYISRSEGCPHMHCSRCGTEFCYSCGKKYFRSRAQRNPVFRFLVGEHQNRFSPVGCSSKLLPNSAVRRKLVRGSVLGGKVVAGVVLSGPLLVCAVAALLGVGVYATVRGGAQLTRRLKQKRRRQAVVVSRTVAEIPRPSAESVPSVEEGRVAQVAE